MFFFSKAICLSENTARVSKQNNNMLCYFRCSKQIYEQTNKNECIRATFLDYKKAFNGTSHSIFLHKLDHYGIRGEAHKLLKSFVILLCYDDCNKINEYEIAI